MSTRVTLTDFEIEQLVKGLESLSNQTSLDYEVITVGKRFYKNLIFKLRTE